MAKIGYFIAVVTADFWLFESIFGCLFNYCCNTISQTYDANIS
jgi:hypothetical protein